MTKKQIRKQIKRTIKAVKSNRITSVQADAIQRLLSLAAGLLWNKG